MSKFLSVFIQKTSGFLLAKHKVVTMSKRNSYHRTPKFKPEVKSVNQRSKQSPSLVIRKEKVEVLPQPIKSESDRKLYKTIRLENGLTALLISDPASVSADDDSSSSEEVSSGTESSEPESGSGKSGWSMGSDQPHGTKRRTDFDEEKLMRCWYKRRVVVFMKKHYFRYYRKTKKRCKMIMGSELSQDTAACALSVGVGSYSDPADIQGLAHFVEHMVFMGSDKYPKENEFDSFVKKKGGSDNASTDCEVTTFYFEIPEKHLPLAMDMFSQFFVNPLMSKEAMQREREAIESEFAIAHPSDANRKDQLLCSMFPEGHPARTFTWGNLKSLRDDIADDDKLYQAAHEFRRRHYSAHRITVAVQARMELSTLEQYVVNTFGNIPTNKLAPDDFSQFSSNSTAPSPDFNKIYYVKPVSDTTELHLTWCMRSLISEYQSKPHQYISYLLGHEGKGSLLSYLRKKVWALGIYTGNSESGIDYTSMYSLFATQVVLTKQGLDHIDEVLGAIFSYIEMLRRIGPSERIYKEIKTIEDTSFRYEQESQPADYVENLVENMHFYPPEHYITGDRLYYKYDPKAISELLNSMTADSVNIMILSNKHSTPIQYDLKETWFGTDYKKIDIPHKWMENWLHTAPIPEFHLPDENIYLTSDFDLIPPAQPYVAEARRVDININTTSAKDMYNKVQAAGSRNITLKKEDLMVTVNNFRLDQPNLLRKNRHMELWYRPDFKFRFPTALLYFYFITPLSLKSPREACLLDLWTDVLQQGLKEEVYPANMADLQHSLYVGDKGLTLKVNGYSQNLHLLVDLITREMRTNTNNLTEPLFEAVREERARNYHNLLIKPHKLAKDIRMNILIEPYISPRDKATLVRNITLSELKQFNQRLFTKLYMQTLMQGNIPWYEAIRIAENVFKTISWDSFKPDEYPELQVHQLPLGEKKIRVMSLNPLSTNSIVTNYYQGEVTTPEDTAVLELLTMLMEEPVFDALRTKEQLGYSVYSMMRYTFGVLGFSVTVNTQVDKFRQHKCQYISSATRYTAKCGTQFGVLSFSVTVNTQVDKFSVSHVDARVEAFLKKFSREMTKKLTEKSLSATKKSLIQLKHTTDYELKEEVERNWREILSREYEFQRLFNEANAIAKVFVPHIRAWVDNHFPTGNGSHFRKLSVQIMGHKIDKTTSNVSTATSNVSLSSEELRKHYHLTYLDASQPVGDAAENQADFIKDIPTFVANLPIIEVPRIELVQC